MLISVIEEARATINDLQDDLRTQEATVFDLTQQLTSSHSSREEASRKAARTIENLHASSEQGEVEEKTDPDEY